MAGARGSGLRWAALAAALVLSAPPAQTSTLEVAEASDGSFRLALPAPLPSPREKSRRTLMGRIQEAHYDVVWGARRVQVEHYDIPRVATAMLPSGVLLDRAANGLVEDADAEELERVEHEQDGLPARSVTYRLPGDRGALERSLIVLAQRRIYIVSVTGAPGNALGPGLERILASFRVLAP